MERCCRLCLALILAVIAQNAGVTVSDELITAFEAMKLRKEIRVLVGKIDKGSVVLDAEATLLKSDPSVAGLTDEALHELIVKRLPDTDCAFFLYDFPLVTRGQADSKIVLIQWSVIQRGNPSENSRNLQVLR